MVIGTPDLPALVERARAVEDRIGHQIQFTVLTQEECDADDTGFLHTVRNGPIVSLQ